jgi:hypothetical protein
MKRTISFAVMLALALSGCVTAEQQQVDADRYERLHAAALMLAKKVDRGEMSKEEATLELVQMELMSSDDQHKMVQGAATEAPIATSLFR